MTSNGGHLCSDVRSPLASSPAPYDHNSGASGTWCRNANWPCRRSKEQQVKQSCASPLTVRITSLQHFRLSADKSWRHVLSNTNRNWVSGQEILKHDRQKSWGHEAFREWYSSSKQTTSSGLDSSFFRWRSFFCPLKTGCRIEWKSSQS